MSSPGGAEGWACFLRWGWYPFDTSRFRRRAERELKSIQRSVRFTLSFGHKGATDFASSRRRRRDRVGEPKGQASRLRLVLASPVSS